MPKMVVLIILSQWKRALWDGLLLLFTHIDLSVQMRLSQGWGKGNLSQFVPVTNTMV